MDIGSWSSVVAAAWVLAAGPPAPATLIQLRDDARQLVRTHCGVCHSATSPKALPGALKVYDTDQADWTRRMSDAQVSKILQRFRGPAIPQNEIDRVTAYVEAELASRRERTH